MNLSKQFKKLDRVTMHDLSKIKVNRLNAKDLTGTRIGEKFAYADVAINYQGIPNSTTFFNKHILRSALLNSPGVLAEVLGLQVTDIYEEAPENVDYEAVIPVEEPKEKVVKVIDVDMFAKAPEENEIESLTATELKARLDKADVPYNATASKKELVKLVKESRAS